MTQEIQPQPYNDKEYSKSTRLYLEGFPDGLKDKLRIRAYAAGKSINTFTVFMLSSWLIWDEWLNTYYSCEKGFVDLSVRLPKDLYHGLDNRAHQFDHKVDKLIIRILEEWVDNQVKEAKAGRE